MNRSWSRSLRHRRLRTTTVLATIYRLSHHWEATLRRPLVRPSGQAVFCIIQLNHPFTRRHTSLSLAIEVVVGVGEIYQFAQLTHTLGHKPSKLVFPNVDLLQTLQPREARRQRAHELVVTRIKHCHVFQGPNFLREATAQIIVQEDDLVQVLHVPD